MKKKQKTSRSMDSEKFSPPARVCMTARGWSFWRRTAVMDLKSNMMRVTFRPPEVDPPQPPMNMSMSSMTWENGATLQSRKK